MVNKMYPGLIILFLPCLLPLAGAGQSGRPDICGRIEIYEKLHEKINTILKPVTKLEATASSQ